MERGGEAATAATLNLSASTLAASALTTSARATSLFCFAVRRTTSRSDSMAWSCKADSLLDW